MFESLLTKINFMAAGTLSGLFTICHSALRPGPGTRSVPDKQLMSVVTPPLFLFFKNHIGKETIKSDVIIRTL